MDDIERIAEIAQEQIDQENASNPAIQAVLLLVEDFLKSSRVMCYGGTAINNLLPPADRFYDPKTDIPDYDFFSETPQLHAMSLADEIAKAGYKNVEVKPGMHMGTFKVFADFTGVADISFLEKDIFERLWDDSIEKNGIRYAPPNFLRMSVYLELSRPRGDVSRWKKVYSRIQLLNKHYPILCPANMETFTENMVPDDARKQVEALMLREKTVLLGFNASTVQQSSGHPGRWKLPLDVLVSPEKREDVAEEFRKILAKYAGVSIRQNAEFGEILPLSTDVLDTASGIPAVRVYETNACHSYHETTAALRIASIPTLLQFFLAMMYGNETVREHTPEQRFLCTAQHLVEMANDRLPRRYKLLTPIECLGTQDSIIDIKLKRSIAYSRATESGRDSKEFLRHFFTYDPNKTTPSKKQSLKEKLKSLTEPHSS